MTITPELLKRELERLSLVVKEKAKADREKLGARGKLLRDLAEIGFRRFSKNKFVFHVKNNDESIVSFIVEMNGKTANVYEDHFVVVDGKEVLASTTEKPFRKIGVRYGRVLMEIHKRILELEEEFLKDVYHV